MSNWNRPDSAEITLAWGSERTLKEIIPQGGQKIEVDLSGLARGVYQLRVISEGGILVRKVVVM